MDVRLYRIYFTTSFGVLPRYTGGMARGMFFSALKRYDQHFATEIHDKQGIKLFSLSGFRRLPNGRGEQDDETLSTMRKALGLGANRKQMKTKDGDVVYIDVVTADKDLASAIPKIASLTWIAPKNGVEFKPFQMVPIDFKVVMSIDLPNPFEVRFITPVSFTTGPNHYPWPDPRYLIQNLSSIWNAWFPDDKILAEEIMKTHAPKVEVDFASGKVTAAATAHGMVHKGWTGKVKYKSKGENPHLVFSLLMKLGFFTGVGRGRTAGLGRFFFPKHLHPNDLNVLS